MKQVLILVSVFVCTLQAASLFKINNINEKLTGDFLTGFESGLFLRNNTKQFDDYSCPDQHVDSKEFSDFKTSIGPMKMLAGALTGGKVDPVIEEILNTIELFVGSFDKFIGVFDDSYTGGDFCAGLTFGMQGSKMLEKVATTLYETHLKGKAQEARSHNK